MRELPRALSRRDFIKRGLFLAGAAPVAAPMTFTLHPELELEQVEIPIEHLPAQFEGFRIGFLTDLHLSAFLQEGLLETAVKKLKELNLDILLLGGDYIWKPREALREAFPVYRREFSDLLDPGLEVAIYRQLTELIGEIRPRDGIFAILGNHDRWAAATICERIFNNTPIGLLINQQTTISRSGATLEIFGTDDYLTGRPRLPTQADTGNIRILLTHNPDMLDWYLDRNQLRFSLALMGHTHGGQVCPLRGMAISYNIANSRYGEGLVQHPSGCLCYTSRGIGCVGLPIRINCPPEITLLTLQRAGSEKILNR